MVESLHKHITWTKIPLNPKNRGSGRTCLPSMRLHTFTSCQYQFAIAALWRTVRVLYARQCILKEARGGRKLYRKCPLHGRGFGKWNDWPGVTNQRQPSPTAVWACVQAYSHIFLAGEAPPLWSRNSRRLFDSTSMVAHNNFIKLFLCCLLLVSLSPGRRLCWK